MWLITQNGFLSLVQDRKDASKVWVRARIKEDIAQSFPAYADQIVTKPGADYLFRLLIDKDVAALAMWNEVQDIDYDSHAKEEMNRRSHPNPQRMSAYYKIWNALADLQPFAPYSTVPRPVKGLAPKTAAQSALAFSSSAPTWIDGDDHDAPLSTGSWLRNGKGRHYDWDQHPQSTGFRNGQPVGDYGTTDDLTDDQLMAMSEEDFMDYVVKNEPAPHVPSKPRNPRRRGRKGRK